MQSRLEAVASRGAFTANPASEWSDAPGGLSDVELKQMSSSARQYGYVRGQQWTRPKLGPLQQQRLSAALQAPLLDALATEGTTPVVASSAGGRRSGLHADVAVHNAAPSAVVGDGALDDGDSTDSDAAGVDDILGSSISRAVDQASGGGLGGRFGPRVAVGMGREPLGMHEEGVTGGPAAGRTVVGLP